jgi:hypothetical protein
MKRLFLFAVLLLTSTSLAYAQSEKTSTKTKQNQTGNTKQLSKIQQEILDLTERLDKAGSTPTLKLSTC